MSESEAIPQGNPEPSGVYQHCVWCGAYNYNVHDYSLGWYPCWTCGDLLPDRYIKRTSDNEGTIDFPDVTVPEAP